MVRLNFRDVRHRFSHVDAEFVESRWSVPGSECVLTVRFYPWWEHPGYLHARKHGTAWAFDGHNAGAKNVSVWAIEPLECNLKGYKAGDPVAELSFRESDPLLMPYEDSADLTINEEFEFEHLISGVSTRLGKIPGEFLWQLTDRHRRFKPPYSTGDLPRTLFNAVQDTLTSMSVPTFTGRQPEAREFPILFDIDGDQFIIARDFEVDVPTFEHSPGWFRTDIANEAGQ